MKGLKPYFFFMLVVVVAAYYVFGDLGEELESFQEKTEILQAELDESKDQRLRFRELAKKKAEKEYRKFLLADSPEEKNKIADELLGEVFLMMLANAAYMNSLKQEIKKEKEKLQRPETEVKKPLEAEPVAVLEEAPESVLEKPRPSVVANVQVRNINQPEDFSNPVVRGLFRRLRSNGAQVFKPNSLFPVLFQRNSPFKANQLSRPFNQKDIQKNFPETMEGLLMSQKQEFHPVKFAFAPTKAKEKERPKKFEFDFSFQSAQEQQILLPISYNQKFMVYIAQERGPEYFNEQDSGVVLDNEKYQVFMVRRQNFSRNLILGKIFLKEKGKGQNPLYFWKIKDPRDLTQSN